MRGLFFKKKKEEELEDLDIGEEIGEEKLDLGEEKLEELSPKEPEEIFPEYEKTQKVQRLPQVQEINMDIINHKLDILKIEMQRLNQKIDLLNEKLSYLIEIIKQRLY